MISSILFISLVILFFLQQANRCDASPSTKQPSQPSSQKGSLFSVFDPLFSKSTKRTSKRLVALAHEKNPLRKIGVKPSFTKILLASAFEDGLSEILTSRLLAACNPSNTHDEIEIVCLDALIFHAEQELSDHDASTSSASKPFSLSHFSVTSLFESIEDKKSRLKQREEERLVLEKKLQILQKRRGLRALRLGMFRVVDKERVLSLIRLGFAILQPGLRMFNLVHVCAATQKEVSLLVRVMRWAIQTIPLGIFAANREAHKEKDDDAIVDLMIPVLGCNIWAFADLFLLINGRDVLGYLSGTQLVEK